MRTFVDRLLHSRAAAAVVAHAPVPLWVVRPWLRRDNAAETAKDSWARLADPTEAPRYAAVAALVHRWAAAGPVLDVGCSRGTLQSYLAGRDYVGIDADARAVARAAEGPGRFEVADAGRYVPVEPPGAVVLNEVVYYLPDPVVHVRRYAGLVAPSGVVVVSVYAGTWASRRLLGRLARELEPVAQTTAGSGHLAWAVAAYRPKVGP